MNENFIPTTEHVREAYSVILEPKGEKLSITLSPEREAEFDRWLAARDAVITRAALKKLSGRVSALEVRWDGYDTPRAEGMSAAAGKIQALIAEQIDDIYKKARDPGGASSPPPSPSDSPPQKSRTVWKSASLQPAERISDE